ncbi:aminoglycoside phosphotransferase family protein [Alteribacter natronophilus]|uniref:aminoglycoside phosphotransferase family protein n=1 Tax=Alteribacter natronophilus TaxID=2583810 RepID=UPI00110EFD55|nr:aminoglycoside phosphotransferase family protein [Alteribacter natronophilus]TMW71051.1 aminoglycoside phosphotransferase family protein [Alteribacter natronophilus]
MKSLPESWEKYKSELEVTGKPVKWELLRKWQYSEVWRITFLDGSTAIGKIGTGHPAREGAVYRELLGPLPVSQPCVYHSSTDGGTGVLLMEDLKGRTLEQEPSETGYIRAAEQLAIIRKEASAPSGKLKNQEPYKVTPRDTLHTLTSMTGNSYLDKAQKQVLNHLLQMLPPHLEKLYRHFPATLCHSDYFPKNLIVNGDSITPVDWALAYVSPDLGDLYCLLLAAEGDGLDRDAVLKAFTSKTEPTLTKDLDWQLTLGGILWTVRMLDWTLRYGIGHMPIAGEWLPEMIEDLETLSGKLPHSP